MSKNENLKYFPGKKNAGAFKSKLSICSRSFFFNCTNRNTNLNFTSTEDIQDYNTFTDLEYFSNIWIIIKQLNQGDLAVKFIHKLMLIQKQDPRRNKIMMGFSNNSENTVFNLRFLNKFNSSLCTLLLDTYTTLEKRLLFEAHSNHTGKFRRETTTQG